MREILFRGKVVESDCHKSGEWVYGYFINCASQYDGPEKDRIAEIIEVDRIAETIEQDADRIYRGEYSTFDAHSVDLQTVGQWTGLVDKNGVKIFEGDIVDLSESSYAGFLKYEIVEYVRGGFSPFAYPGWECTPDPDEVAVIGNHWDNPELVN